MTKVWLGKLPLLILGQLNFLSPSFMCHTYIAPALRGIWPARCSMILGSQEAFRPVPGVGTHEDS